MAYADAEYGVFNARPNASRTKTLEIINLTTGEKQIVNTMKDADRYCGFGLDYTSKRLKKTNEKTFIRDNYQITILN